MRTPSPTGSFEEIEKYATKTASASLIANLFSTVHVGPDGLPRGTSNTPEEKRAAHAAQYASIAVQTQGRLLAEILGRIATKFGVPDERELAVFLTMDGRVDGKLAAALARAYRHFWNEDYEACVYVIVPKIEAAARALLRQLDEGIYRVAAEHELGGYPGLYVLLDELKKLDLDPSWAFYLNWLLIDFRGANLRNSVAHGFVEEVGPEYAALVLRAAALLIDLVGPRPHDQADYERDTGLTVNERRDRTTVLQRLAHPIADPLPPPRRSVGSVVRGTLALAAQHWPFQRRSP